MSEESTPKERALIVDDDMDMRRMLAFTMRRAGYEVDVAENGEEGLEKARAFQPSVVITDLHMPGVDGMTMLMEIRRWAPHMPIVMLTASDGIGPAVDAMRAGADDYLTKPVDPHALRFAVERAISRQKQRAETDIMRRTLNELREAHVALEAERDFVSTVLGTIESLVVVMDLEGRIVKFNRACEHATGYEESEMLGTNAIELLVGADEVPEVRRVFEELASGGTRRNTYENHWRTKNGEMRRITWTNTVLLDESGQVKHVVASGMDVTDVRNMEARVRRSEHLASIATFSAGVAHEIKNPLNAATLHLTLLGRLLGKASPDLEGAREAAGIATGEIRRVGGLLEEFLQFARPETPRRSATDLRQICDDVAALCRVEAAAANIEISVTGDPRVAIRADDARMRQVVLNLVRNAIEAVRQNGHVQLDVGHTGNTAHVRVQDDGPGIMADDIRIFQPFFTTKEKGTGLGLAITHRIVTDHGGDIAVESRPGKTVFTVTLPMG